MGNHQVDVVVVGAGMAGLYLLYRLRKLGFSAVALERGDDVGGTWYWNRYPGARCDIESIDYSYSFDDDLQQEWEWSERYATQPEILRYLQHVADRHDLRRDIRFEVNVERAEWRDDDDRWTVTVDNGDTYDAQWYVMATGCLSQPKEVDIAGVDDFGGETYLTGRWPHEGVDFTGKRVAVIGTGSSAIQSIPLIADQAAALTVYQRTPNFSLPAGNRPNDPERVAAIKARYPEYREEARWSRAGVPMDNGTEMWWQLDADERERRLEATYGDGILGYGSTIGDTRINPIANEGTAEFVRNKIRAMVDDPETAESMCPSSYAIFTKRLCLDTNYFATFNRDHVELVDLRKQPFVSITETGIANSDREREFDAIVFATGFDAMTGAIVNVDIRGRGGVELKDVWRDGPATYLGLSTVGFPNLFFITGPQSPSVLSNMAVSIEQHVEWVTDCVAAMRDQDTVAIEPTPLAQQGWGRHVNDCASITLFPEADSWYMGANVPGKPRVVLPYLGGVGNYRAACNQVVEGGWIGFERHNSDGSSQITDGLVRELQLDVALMLEAIGELGLPPIESMSVDDARGFIEASRAMGPPGRAVGEIVDATFPGADGELGYRLYRPATDGPHRVVLYFHGGGWVLGSHTSDDSLCRDLCAKADAVIVSCDYRHAPEHRFPAPVDDAWAALNWVNDNLEALGGKGAPLLAGWSAGGNLAAVTAQRARDDNLDIAGQVLITPVVDSDMSRESYADNGEGYQLTLAMMRWFWDHYAPDVDQRTDPRAAPLRGNLNGLAPCRVVTAQFDPLRDEGAAYVTALVDAGVDARLLPQRGQIHTSFGAVDVLISPEKGRQEIAAAMVELFGLG